MYYQLPDGSLTPSRKDANDYDNKQFIVVHLNWVSNKSITLPRLTLGIIVTHLIYGVVLIVLGVFEVGVV